MCRAIEYRGVTYVDVEVDSNNTARCLGLPSVNGRFIYFYLRGCVGIAVRLRRVMAAAGRHDGLCAPLPTAIILVSIVSSSTIEMGTTDNPDPFAIFHTPPPNETAGERAAREEREAAARKVSDRIDEELKQEKARLKRQKVIRVLLLGQSESGESRISLSN